MSATQPKPKSRDRGKKIMFWLEPEQVIAIRKLADENGMRSAAAWIRTLTIKQLRHELRRNKAA